jgi:prevent-host-death family protein
MATKISIADAGRQLTELVRCAEAGEDIVLTRNGHDAIRLSPIPPARKSGVQRRRLERL